MTDTDIDNKSASSIPLPVEVARFFGFASEPEKDGTTLPQ